jgi:hypothetical protein
MYMDALDAVRVIVCFSVPLGFWAWWVWARLGRDKRWFVAPMPLISRNFYFALPTVMLGVIVLLIGLLFTIADPNNSNTLYFLYIAFGLWGISYIIAYLEPDWMSPEWYRWMKREYGDILPYLAQEAHQLGRKEWLSRVETQADLEVWVAEVRRKYRF